MSVIAASLRELMAAGLEGEALIAAVERIEAALPTQDASAERRRSKDRDRKRAQRLRNSAESADGADITPLDGPPFPHTPNPPLNPPSSLRSPQPRDAKPTPRSELEAVLDAERAQAVIDHRQRKRAPLTAHAAKLLARKLAACPDANAAADLMIEKGWQSVEPDWVQRESGLRRAPQRAPPAGGGWLDALNENLNEARQ